MVMAINRTIQVRLAYNQWRMPLAHQKLQKLSGVRIPCFCKCKITQIFFMFLFLLLISRLLKNASPQFSFLGERSWGLHDKRNMIWHEDSASPLYH